MYGQLIGLVLSISLNFMKLLTEILGVDVNRRLSFTIIGVILE